MSFLLLSASVFVDPSSSSSSSLLDRNLHDDIARPSYCRPIYIFLVSSSLIIGKLFNTIIKTSQAETKTVEQETSRSVGKVTFSFYDPFLTILGQAPGRHD